MWKLKNSMKKKCTIVWGVLIACLMLLVINYVANEIAIKDYSIGIYKKNFFSGLGVLEPCIAPYNEGNRYYEQGDYENAVKAYQTALKKSPDEQEECNIRINLALAMVKPLDLKEGEAEELIPVLEAAEEVLCEKGCANDQGTGHDEDAQQLRDEIAALLEELKQDRKEDDNNEKKQDDKKEKDDKKKTEDIKEQLLELQQQGTQGRNNKLDEAKYLSNFDFYDGKTW